jgi:hypothetical protein
MFNLTKEDIVIWVKSHQKLAIGIAVLAIIAGITLIT